MFHHSSFLGGADVMCGGELMAKAGKITYLSAKTGHYKATTKHLVWALTVLETCVNNFDEIKVLVFKEPPGGGKSVPKLVDPKQVMWNALSYESWGDLGPKQIDLIRSGQFGSFAS
jgi:hypothetical protein